MEVLAEHNDPYVEDFRVGLRARGSEPVWLVELRQAAINSFERLGFPTKRWENWRNLDLKPISGGHFAALRVPGDAEALVQSAAAIVPGHQFVFVDGYPFKEPAGDALPEGVAVRSLAAAVEAGDSELQRHFGRAADAEAQPFVALNTAFTPDAACIHIGRNVVVEAPIVVIHVASAEAAERAVYPRTLVVAEEGAQARLVEIYVSSDGRFLSAPVSEVIVKDNARVDLYKLQEEGADAWHLATVAARVARDGRFFLHSFAGGGKVARTDVIVTLEGPGAEAELDGLYLTREGQYLDHHTWMNHDSGHCNSRQRFKGVLQGKSEAVFDGLVRVAKDAQKTDARQENRNLVLSKRALAHSNPRLEIHADDVKCSHGSTIGELDPEALFYLRSRGVSYAGAQALLTFAFVNEMLESVAIDELRDYERARIFEYLPGDQTVREVQ